MVLNPDKAKEYADLLASHRFSVGDGVFKEHVRDVPSCYATIVGNEERISVMTRESASPAFIAMNPACAMDLALTILRLVRNAEWYGDDPISNFAAIQQRADAELERAKQENLGSQPLGMNAPRVLASFRRNPNGTWTCIREVRIATDIGDLTIRPGQTFNPKGGLQMSGVNWGEHLEWMWSRPDKPQ